MKGSTIVVRYKETRLFHIAMPFTKQLYETGTGGNVLGSNDAASNNDRRNVIEKDNVKCFISSSCKMIKIFLSLA